MPLTVLLPLVIIGIAGLAGLLHVLGLSRRSPLTPQEARAAWVREFPGSVVTDVAFSRDATAALISTTDGPGIVWRMGADTTARSLAKARVSATDTGLVIDLNDFTAPRLRLCLGAKSTRHWINTIGAAA